MRLLMTRPQPDASISADRLRKLGHEVIISPVLETAFSKNALSWRPGEDLIVTSRNGVRALAALANAEMRSSALLFTVGDATAALAKEAGFLNTLSASGATDDLVALATNKKPKKLLYICGRERKGNLEQKLREQGICVDVAERYHTDFSSQLNAKATQALEEDALDGVLLYSARSAEAFNHLIQQKLVSYLTKRITYFCLAKAIAFVLDRDIRTHAVVAQRPDEQSLCDAIQAHVNNC